MSLKWGERKRWHCDFSCNRQTRVSEWFAEYKACNEQSKERHSFRLASNTKKDDNGHPKLIKIIL